MGKSFHGTTADLKTGDLVLPARLAGVKTNYDISHPGLSYFMHSEVPEDDSYQEEMAWTWAAEGTNRRPTDVPKRPMVYLTEPRGEVRPDQNMHFEQYLMGQLDRSVSHRTAPSQTVVGSIPMPAPGWGEQGVQGTMPHVNWNQFATTQTRTGHNWQGVKEVNPPDSLVNHALASLVHDPRSQTAGSWSYDTARTMAFSMDANRKQAELERKEKASPIPNQSTLF